MGAEPIGYLLSIALPKSGLDIDAWLKAFTTGLAANQKQFRWSLWGGDTVSTNGSITISVTAIGTVDHGNQLTRHGAKSGDGIYVSGTLGDAAIALKILENELHSDDKDFFLKRYYKPMPRLKLGKKLHGVASAAIDVSDGLIADLTHICRHSAVGAKIYQEKIPLSLAYSNLLETKKDYSHFSWSGGDDYELLFTVPRENEDTIVELLGCKHHSITKIGEITADKQVRLLDKNDDEINIDNKGFCHFED